MISLKGSLHSYTTRSAEISAPVPSELTNRQRSNAKTLLFGENSAILWLGAGMESRRCYRFCECDFQFRARTAQEIRRYRQFGAVRRRAHFK